LNLPVASSFDVQALKRPLSASCFDFQALNRRVLASSFEFQALKRPVQASSFETWNITSFELVGMACIPL
jgi:hypothetical protein